MPDMTSILHFLCCGLVLLALLNLLLELLGISLLGGESKPGFLVRLIIIIALSLGLGWGFDTYVKDNQAYQDAMEKVHGTMGGEADVVVEEEIMFEDEVVAEDDMAVEEEVMEMADDADMMADEAVDGSVDEAVDEAVDAVEDELEEVVEDIVDEAEDI